MGFFWNAVLPILIVAFIVGVIALVIYGEDISDELDREKYKLQRMNILRECPKCGFYHREYQRTMKMYSDENYRQVESGKYYFKDGKLVEVDVYFYEGHKYACPHCLHHTTNRVEKQFGWEKDHIDCGEITKKGLRQFDKTLSELNRLSYEQKTLKYIQEEDRKRDKLNEIY